MQKFVRLLREVPRRLRPKLERDLAMTASASYARAIGDLQHRNPLFFGFLGMGLHSHLVRFGKFEKKARVGCSNEVFLITRARDWLHCAGIEEAVFNETLVDVNANHLTECNEPWSGIAVDIFELDSLQPLTFQRAW
jgi:hypothetical protein